MSTRASPVWVGFAVFRQRRRSFPSNGHDSTMKLAEAGERLSSLFPPQYAEEWDNGGWMIGPLEESLTGILICVDPSPEALEAALDRDLNLVLSHHPLIFDPVERLVDDEPVPALIHRAIRNRVGVYAAHTSADSMPGGLNDVLAGRLDLEDCSPLRRLENEPGAGLGRTGTLVRPLSLEEVEEKLAEVLPLSRMKIIGEPNRRIEKIALCTGSGGDFIGAKLARSADLYVTADVKHHPAMEARQWDLPLIVLDHHEMETVFLDRAHELCREQFPGEFPLHRFRRTNPYRVRTF